MMARPRIWWREEIDKDEPHPPQDRWRHRSGAFMERRDGFGYFGRVGRGGRWYLFSPSGRELDRYVYSSNRKLNPPRKWADGVIRRSLEQGAENSCKPGK